ncbi:ABC transporter substrate-binding protein [Bradyrhizobium arachidis]|uniref:ABC transporter substrate-binding protein n=1 Tax=Bradyrhizobium arachidis TaxID=858423 RepID=UPI0021611E79|nr:ABC transporter substrate-binding protein [Bradyrhizobium arachidis]UVO34679.1 ABC transporter substrate-binding protein [Bradyrhizobium arachidis]
MKRREFITALGGSVLYSVTAFGQHGPKKRLALVHPSAKAADMRIGGDADDAFTIFFQELQRLGYVEAQNLIVERYSAEGQPERYSDIAREVVGTHPDVIAVAGAGLAAKLKAATSTIPMAAITGDPIRFGLVPSLSRPGGNITGVSFDAGIEIWSKRVEILAEAVPGLRRVAFVGPQAALDGQGGKATREAAGRLGIDLVSASVATPVNEQAYRHTFEAIGRDRADGFVFASDVESYPLRHLIVELVKQVGLPAIFTLREQAAAGGLLSYATDLKFAIRASAGQVAEILRGGNPAEMPYIQGTRFELVINLNTANALGLTISPTLLARADEVIE